MDISDFGFSPSIVAALDDGFSPAEDFSLALLRDIFPDVTILSLIPLDQSGEAYHWPQGGDRGQLDYFILVRRVPGLFYASSNSPVLDLARMSIQVFCKDPDGDMKAALIHEAIRKAFEKLHLESPMRHYPGLGSLNKIIRGEEAVRKTDWATSTGPVQFADLPTSFHRWEAEYDFYIRKERKKRTTP